MITHQTQVTVAHLSAKDVYDFLINPADDRYQKWWPGVHLRFHNLRTVPGNIGNIVYMDEIMGEWRLRTRAIVVKAEPNKRIGWRMKKIIRLPAQLNLQLQDTKDGVRIDHVIYLGFRGLLGKAIDPLWRLYLNADREECVTNHVNAEFKRLSLLLHPEQHQT